MTRVASVKRDNAMIDDIDYGSGNTVLDAVDCSSGNTKNGGVPFGFGEVVQCLTVLTMIPVR